MVQMGLDGALIRILALRLSGAPFPLSENGVTGLRTEGLPMKSTRVPIVLFAFGISLSAAPSQAQTTTTNCLHVGQQLFCNSYTPPAPAVPAPVYPTYQPQPAFGINPALVQMLIARKQQQMREEQAEQDREAEAEQRADDQSIQVSVGKMIEDGNCDGAKHMALDEGRLDLVPLVNQACAAPAPTPTPTPVK